MVKSEQPDPEPTLTRKTGEDPEPLLWPGVRRRQADVAQSPKPGRAAVIAQAGVVLAEMATRLSHRAKEDGHMPDETKGTAWDEAEKRARLLIADGKVGSIEEGVRLILDSDPALYAKFRSESYSEDYARRLTRPRPSAPASPKLASAVGLEQPYWTLIENMAQRLVKKGSQPDMSAALQQLFDWYPGLEALYRREASGM